MPVLTRVVARLRGLHPAQVIVLGFFSALAVGTAALMLPVARAGRGGATFMDALFTAASAVCVTGLSTVDVRTYWTGFGDVVILLLVQVGGLGVMTFATVLGIVVARRMGLRTRLTAASETKTEQIGGVRGLATRILTTALLFEGGVALVLWLRWWVGYGENPVHALWLAVFHAVSAFNNAGFALFSDNLIGYGTDPAILLPLCVAVIAGGMGFPVLHELHRTFRRPVHWTMNTRIVVVVSAVLLAVGTGFFLAVEWTNPATLGGLGLGGKLLAAFTQSTMARTAGFNSIDTGAMTSTGWFGTDILMFIGAGPAGTGGGIKVTTFAVLFFIILAEVRGDVAVNVLGRRLPRSTHRQAISVALLSVAAVVGATMVLMMLEDFGLDRTLFEAISAFATVGLSTGITADLPALGQLVLVVLMFVGRLGPITLATALVLRRRTRLYELPKERPIIG
ncbi:TrkH family potassium uptake protein [Cellulomonas sp. PhB143]|uniref:TrkH family potassium uptake protein n=1 Tax=Cellulomonas sp. PhB143 TaxID=2485186 RepID=UPI000FC06337|nr:potassium transporter TrkG [Cellulomonas sp. PhB143]ROS75266.1 potassium uptake TrkH family protein [Cellulomonas sp. PhB143]